MLFGDLIYDVIFVHLSLKLTGQCLSKMFYGGIYEGCHHDWLAIGCQLLLWLDLLFSVSDWQVNSVNEIQGQMDL